MSHFDPHFDGNPEDCSESVVVCLRAVAQRLDRLQSYLAQISTADLHPSFNAAVLRQQLQQDIIVLRQLAGRARLSVGTQPDLPASSLLEMLTQPHSNRPAADRQPRITAAMLRFRLGADRSIVYEQRQGDWEAVYGSTTAATANPADWLEHILPADRETIVLPAIAALTQQSFLSVEYRFLHEDGRLRWLQAHFTSERDDSANCWRITCIQTDITVQKQSEQHITQIEERFVKVFRASPIAMCISRLADGLMIEVNDRYLELVEYDRQELLGKTSIELGILQPQERVFLLSILLHQPGQPVEWWYHTRSGRRRLARTAAEPIDLNGEPHLLILAEDVTDYRRVQSDLQQLNETLESIVQQRTQELQASQAALQTSQRQLEAILNNSPLVVYLLDRENRHLLVNHRYEELVGLSREQLVGAPLEAIWGSADGTTPGSAGTAFEHIRQVWETGEAIETEEALQVQGQERIFLSSKFPLFDSEGGLYAVGGICLDITERVRIEADRQRAEAVLAQREREYRTLVENCPDVIIRLDRTGRYLYVSPSFSQMFGVSQEDCIGKTDLEIGFPPDLSARCSSALQRLFQQCEEQTLEFSIPTPAGLQFHQSKAVPEVDDRGNVISALIVGREITQMKQAEQRLQEAVTELERVNRLKDEFLSTVSHELRTPVSNMKLSIRMLEVAMHQASIEPDARMRQYMTILNRECGREISLINDLLDLQRLEANHDSIMPESIDLKIWLSRLLEPFHERARNRQQTLRLDLPQMPLPQLFSDPSILDRILAELLNNACKYTPPGEQIVVQAAIEAQTVLLSVQNSGIEIPTAELPRIFDKFYRVPSTDPWKQGGTGLGLALVQKLVEHLQGTIQVQSRFGNTTFTVILPIAHLPHP